MNKLRTMTEIVRDRMAAKAALSGDAEALRESTQRVAGRLQRRMTEDQAVGALVNHYAEVLYSVLRTVPAASHEFLMRSCLLEILVEWEDCSRAFDEQLRQAPVS